VRFHFHHGPVLSPMDEGRKRVLLIAASILAARKLAQYDGGTRVPEKAMEGVTKKYVGQTQQSANPSPFCSSNSQRFHYTSAMTFWDEVLAIFLGDVFASVLLIVLYVMIQWFLRATDVTVAYNWSFTGPNFYPNFDIRNRSGSRTYLLANIAYTRNDGREKVWFDNDSIMDEGLPPGSIRGRKFKIVPVKGLTTAQEAMNLEVTVRLQNGRAFWLTGVGPGQTKMSRTQRIAFWLRDRFEKAAIPLE